MQDILNHIFPEIISNRVILFLQTPTAKLINDSFHDHDVFLQCSKCFIDRYCFCLARYCSVCSTPICLGCSEKCFTYMVKNKEHLNISICKSCILSINNNDHSIEVFNETTKDEIIALMIH